MAISPEEILEKDFSLARKGGFVPDEVRNYLSAVSRDMQRQRDRLEALRAEVDRLATENALRPETTATPEVRREVPDKAAEDRVEEPTMGAMVRGMVAQVMAQAEIAAAELLADAERDADRVRAEADELMDRARSRAGAGLTPAAGR